jgi:pyridoxal biosynthesis lyase PdxS
MADRTDPAETRNASTPNDPNRSYIAAQRTFSNPKLVDEVITHLANAPENRRARQVGEWERLQNRSFRTVA